LTLIKPKEFEALTSSAVENIPNGRFSMEKGESSATGSHGLSTILGGKRGDDGEL